MFRLNLSNIVATISTTLIIISCNSSSSDFDGSTEQGVNTPAGADGGSSNTTAGEPSVLTKVNGQPVEDVLCQLGPKILALVDKGDFTDQFALICDNNTTTNEAFKDMIRTAYDGTGDPKIHLLKNTTGDLYVTDIAFGYALKIPLINPSLFADYQAHDIFAEGIVTDTSKLIIDVESRETFPGRKSLESVVLNYDLKVAKGASIFDKRKTEFNTYLLVEENRDVVVSTEYLLDAETNPNYHIANGLTIGLTAGSGETYMVFVTNLVVKNRIDPKRVEEALLDLAGQIPDMLYQHIINTSL